MAESGSCSTEFSEVVSSEEVSSAINCSVTSEISDANRKLEKFLSEPLGNKLVGEIPGLEQSNVDKLHSKGIRKAYVILGVYLALNKDRDDFYEWLKKASNVDKTQFKTCYRALKKWSSKFV